MVAGAIDIKFSCSRIMDLDTDHGCSSGPDISMAQDSSIGHIHLYGPECSIALGHQFGLRWFMRTWATTEHSVATGDWTSTQTLFVIGL